MPFLDLLHDREGTGVIPPPVVATPTWKPFADLRDNPWVHRRGPTVRYPMETRPKLPRQQE